MFLITLHGGDKKTNNIYAYDDAGNLLSDKVLRAKSHDLSELRGFCVQGNYLYVANGGKQVDDIRCFQGMGAFYEEVCSFVKQGSIASIDHPFDLVFDGSGHCFVSNQDTNVVAILDVAADGKTATAAPLPTYLTTGPFAHGTFLPGTFVASSDGKLPNVPQTTPVPIDEGGLAVHIVKEKDGSKKVQNSVRDVALSSGILYVADEPGDVIRLYDPGTGTPLGISNTLKSPVHILINNGMVYVSSSNEVWSAPCSTLPMATPSPPTVCLNLTPLLTGLPGDASGMTFDPSGNFYVAIRTKAPQILKYTSFQAPYTVLIDGSALPDAPEFIAYVLSD